MANGVITHRIRSLLLGSWLSYRALFTWLNPLGYVSSRIVMPVALTLIFGSVGRYAQGSAAGPVVGGMMIGVAFASVYGITLSMANERQFGTMGVWLATPQRLGTSIAIKALPHLVDGQVGALLTLTVACAVFGISLSPSRVTGLMVCSIVAGLATAGFGVVIAACSVRFRDVFTAPNLAESLLIVCGGVVVPASRLPAGLSQVSALLPLSRSITAGRMVLADGHLDLGLLGADLGVGLVWAVLGYALLAFLVRESRRAGAYDLT
jgi:ABC-2 type transport system permease protein